jgi:hypothetical protein
MVAVFMAHHHVFAPPHPHDLMMTSDNFYTLNNLFKNTITRVQAANNSILLMEPFVD